jgi:iron complex outermembrane recepter protein
MADHKFFRYSAAAVAVLCAFTQPLHAAEPAPAAEDNTALEHIEVQIRAPFRGDVPLKQQPIAVETLSDEALDNAGVTSFVEALDLSASIARQNSFGDLWDSFAIRGLVGDENIPSGYLINGFSAGRGYSGTRDTTNIESIEIMKGPGSALFGRSEPGGTINIVTKKPQFDREGYLQVSAGRWDKYRAEADYTDAVSEDVAVRVNGAYEDNKSFRDEVWSKKTVLTPSLLWLVSDTTKLGYELEYVDQDVIFDRGIVALNGDPAALPVSRFLGEASDGPTNVEVTAHQLTLEQNFGQWDLLSGVFYKDSSFISTSSDAELAPARQLILKDGQTLSRQHNQRDFQTTDLTVRSELSGTFTTGDVVHHLLIGADGYSFELNKDWSRFRPAAGQTAYSINVFNPVYGQTAPAGTRIFDQKETQDSYGLFVQDQIDLTAKWKAQVGGRFDSFDQEIENYLTGTSSSQHQTIFNPRAGLVYQWSDSASLYGSYSQGFRPNTGADANNNAFAPEETKSWEMGTKFSLNSVQGSLALFRAEKNNMLTTDPIQGISAALGEVESKGIEVDFSGQLTDSASYIVSYAYTDASTAKDMINLDWGVELPKGSQLLNIPKHSANATVKQQLELFSYPTNLGATVHYVDDRLGETIDPDYILPAYTLVNLFAEFELNDKLSAQLNIDNLFDKTHYVSSYSAIWTMPGAPRSYSASLRYSF